MNEFNDDEIYKFEDKYWDSMTKIGIRLFEKLQESINIDSQLREFYSPISIKCQKQIKTIEL